MSSLSAEIVMAFAVFKNIVSTALLFASLSTRISDECGKEVQLVIIDCDDVNGMGVILTGGDDCSVEAMATCVFDCMGGARVEAL